MTANIASNAKPGNNMDTEGQDVIDNYTDTTPILQSNQDRQISARSRGNVEERAAPRSEDLEPAEKKRKRIHSLRILNAIGIMFSISSSIMLTGAFPYLKELMPNEPDDSLLTKYAIFVSTLPIAQVIISPILGKLADVLQSIRPVSLMLSVMFTGSSMIYATLSAISAEPQTRFYLMVFSRFCAGAFSANIGPIRGYICQITTKAERTKELSILSACRNCGFLSGPVLQALFGMLGCSPLAGTAMKYFSFESYNVCGWVAASMGVSTFVLFLPIFFKEQKFEAVVGEIRNTEGNERDQTETGTNINRNLTKDISTTPDYFGILICLLCMSVYYFNFLFMDVVATPICMEQFGWTQKQTMTYLGIMIGVNGFLSTGYYLSLGKLSKRIEERKLLIWVGLMAQIIGKIVILPIPSAPLPPLIHQRINGSELVEANAHQNSHGEKMFMNMINTNLENWKGIESETPRLGSLKRNSTNELRFLNIELNSFGQVYHEKSFSTVAGNVACEKVSGPPGCNLEWCSYTPAIHVAQFIVGWTFTQIGFAFSLPTTVAIVSKMYGTRRQGLFMSLTVMFGSFSRFLGPFFVSYVYTHYGTYYAVGSTLITLFAAFGMLCLNYNRLVPINSRRS